MKIIKTTISQAEQIAEEIFNIHGEVSNLDGYEDDNFKLTTVEGDSFVLKVSNVNEDKSHLNFQNNLLLHLKSKNLNYSIPNVIPNSNGDYLSSIVVDGITKYIRLLSWVPGRLWADVNPITKNLRFDLGAKSAQLNQALQDFNSRNSIRDTVWDLANADKTFQHSHRFDKNQRELIAHFQPLWNSIQQSYLKLPKSIIHNDINNYNTLVNEDMSHPQVSGFIDFGDVIYTQTINDLAILLAYAIMETPDPLSATLDLIHGYHEHYNISDAELACLYPLVAMRLITSITYSALELEKNPTNEYLAVSVKPAWAALAKWRMVHSEFAYYSFRQRCGYTPHPKEEAFIDWTKNNNYHFSDLFPSEKKTSVFLLDLSVASTWIGGRHEFNDLDHFELKIKQLQKEHPTKLLAGGYCEPRPFYTTTSYDKEGNNGRESRSIHLGIDFWLSKGTAVHTLFDAEVVTSVMDVGHKEYGGLIILKHEEENLIFYTLYGHLSEKSTKKHKKGSRLAKGDCIGYLGNNRENGEWSPHLHFQMMLSMLDYTVDFPGVSYPDQLAVWKSICPDPNFLFKNDQLQTHSTENNKSF